MNPAARRLPALLRRGVRTPSLWSSAPTRPACRTLATAASIPGVLAAASSSKPLKDAVKFMRPAPEKPAIWTYRELNTHVEALAAGLHEVGYGTGDVVMVLLSPQSQEYPVTVLAAARIGASVVVLPTPADPTNVPVAPIAAALERFRPRALFVGKEFQPARGGQEEDGIVAKVNALVNALMPGVALEDAKGLNGFVPLTGRPFVSAKYPFLEHVIHTSDMNLRGTITFKSLLVYGGTAPTPLAGETPLLVSAETGDAVSTAQILADAEALGSELGLTGDHTAKNGKLVVTPSLSERSAAAIVSAVMHETLWVSPGAADTADVSAAENALVV